MKRLLFIALLCVWSTLYAFATDNGVVVALTFDGHLNVTADLETDPPIALPPPIPGPPDIIDDGNNGNGGGNNNGGIRLLTAPVTNIAQINVYTASGTVVYNSTATVTPNSQVCIEGYGWQKGIYTVVVTLTDGSKKTTAFTYL